MAEFNPEHEKALHAMLKNNPAAKASKMFGSPAYKVNGKLAVSLFKDEGIVAKVGPERAKELISNRASKSSNPCPVAPGRTGLCSPGISSKTVPCLKKPFNMY